MKDEVIMKVGILEDNEDNATLLNTLLKQAGHSAEVYDDEMKLLGRFTFEPQRFDALLLNWLMLKRPSNGQAIQHIRKVRPSMPILLISTMPDEEFEGMQHSYTELEVLTTPLEVIASLERIERRQSKEK